MVRSTTPKVRANGQQSRENILLTALRLFVEKGFAGTSVRDVAGAAGVNLAAISYHFGDKAGLYRAALTTFLDTGEDPVMIDVAALSLDEALQQYVRLYLSSLRMGETALLAVRLRVREYIDPTGLLDSTTTERDQIYTLLLHILTRHFDLLTPDEELEALAFAIFGLVSYLYSGQDHLVAVRPALLHAPDAATKWEHRIVAYAKAMIDVEEGRRSSLTHPIEANDEKN